MRSAALFLAACLAACTGGHGSGPHRAELAGFVGISRDELVRRLGQPSAVSGGPDQQFLRYDNLDARYVHPSAGYRYDHGLAGGFDRPPAIASFDCRTIFALENGRVRAFDLTGNGCR